MSNCPIIEVLIGFFTAAVTAVRRLGGPGLSWPQPMLGNWTRFIDFFNFDIDTVINTQHSDL